MATPTAPLFSLRASDTIGKTLTAASWRGVQYTRERVIPENPRTAQQRDLRTTFTAMNKLWLSQGTLPRAPWVANARGRRYTERNHYLATQVPLLHNSNTYLPYVFSPGNGGPSPTLVEHLHSNSGITSICTPPDPPIGWTLAAAIFCDCKDQNPPLVPTIPIRLLRFPAPPYEFSEDPMGQFPHILSWYLEWTDPHGRTRYSIPFPNESFFPD